VINRIAILGGSSVYTPEFIFSLISHNVNVKEIVLVGRNEAKLQIVADFCDRILRKSGFPATVEATTDVETAVTGAKYILNQIRVGGMQARLKDEKLPQKFGMIGDESLGAGGFANAMRTLPVMFDLANQIAKVNPDATIINLTNPLGIVVEALTKYTNLHVVGVCDLPSVYIKRVAAILGRSPEELDIDYIGLNHMGWIQDVRFDGRSYKSVLLEKLEHHEEDGFDHLLIELFRMIPTRTVSLYFHQDEVLKHQKSCGRFRAEVLYEAEKQILKLYEDKHLTDIPDLTRERNAIWYEETILPLIQALENKKASTLVLCVRNGESIRDLSADASVEIPARVSNKGITPRKVGSAPHFLKGMFVCVKESDKLAIEAVRHKSYECALQALTINPLVPSLGSARAFLDKIIKDEQIELH